MTIVLLPSRDEDKAPIFALWKKQKVVNALGLKSWDDWQRWSSMRNDRQISQVTLRGRICRLNGTADWLERKRLFALK